MIAKRNLSRKFTSIILASLLLIIGLIGHYSYTHKGLSSRFIDREEFLNYFENSIPKWQFSTTHGLIKAYRLECDFYDVKAYRSGKATQIPAPAIDTTCNTRDKRKKNSVFIWGDSHAQQLNFGLTKILPNDWQIMQVASSGCPASIHKLGNSKIDYCEKSNFEAFKSIKNTRPNVVVIAQEKNHSAEISSEINDELLRIGVAKVIFIGPTPHWKSELPKIIARKLWHLTPERTFIGIDQDLLIKNQKLKKQFQDRRLSYIDVISLFCKPNAGCLIRLGPDKKLNITTADYGHLLPGASEYVAKNLLAPNIISQD